jgi:chemotaxis protein MotB
MGRFLLGLFAVLLIVTAVLAAGFVLYYQPQTRELEDARQDASRLAQERADLAQQRAALNGRVSDLEHLLDEIRAESEELEAKVQAKEAILAELQSTQDELEQEIVDGQIRVQRLRGQLRVDMVDEILFDSGEATLKPKGRTVLKKVASVLANANRTIQV